MEEKIDNRKLMYNLAKDFYDEELALFYQLEDKANKYLYAISILFGLMLLSFKWIINKIMPPQDVTEIVILTFFVITIISFAIVWALSFSVIKLSKIPGLKFDDDFIQAFEKYENEKIYSFLTKRFKQFYSEIKKINKAKAKNLKISRNIAYIALFFLILTVICTIISLFY